MIPQPNYRTKQPAEKRTLTFDFREKLATGDTLTSIVSVTAAAGVTLGTPSLVGTTVTVQISGGVNGQTYGVTARVNTTQGDVLELDAVISVKEDVN